MIETPRLAQIKQVLAANAANLNELEEQLALCGVEIKSSVSVRPTTPTGRWTNGPLFRYFRLEDITLPGADIGIYASVEFSAVRLEWPTEALTTALWYKLRPQAYEAKNDGTCYCVVRIQSTSTPTAFYLDVRGTYYTRAEAEQHIANMSPREAFSCWIDKVSLSALRQIWDSTPLDQLVGGA